MTEFKIEPIQQVIIQDLVHENIEYFLHHCYARSVTSIIWVDGIIIDATTQSFLSDTAFKKQIEGIKYYEKLVFVKYPEYTKSVKWNGGNYELILLNYNNHPRFKALAKWIKSQPIWKTKPEATK